MNKLFVYFAAGLLVLVLIFPVMGQSVQKVSTTKSYGLNNWSMFRHDANHSGYTASQAPKTNTVLWSVLTGGKIRSSPAAVDGKVYAASYDGKVYCRDALTGNKTWTVNVSEKPLFSSPAVINGYVFIGSYDSFVYCLNTANGDQIWKFKTDDIVTSSPTVLNGRFFIGSWDNTIYCLDADPTDGIDEGFDDPDGVNYDLLWKYQTNGDIRSSPAVTSDFVYIGSYDGNMYCLHTSNGTLKWNFSRIDDWVFSSPTVSDGKVFFGMFWEKTVYCLNAYNGSQIWNRTIDNLIGTSPSVHNNRLYIGSHLGSTGKISCLNLTTGQPIWEFPTGYWVYSSPAVNDDKVYVGSCDKKIYCLHAETGNTIWNYSTGDQVWSSPAISQGNLYIGSDDGTLRAFRDLSYPPDIPEIAGPSGGGTDLIFNFTAVSTHPDEQQVYFKWDWGDGNISDWFGPFNSGELTRANYSWTTNGNYEIRVKAKDLEGAESSWSVAHLISIEPQIEVVNIKSGDIYFKLSTYNEMFLHSDLLSIIGATIFITDYDLLVVPVAQESVCRIKIVWYKPLTNESSIYEDNNISDGLNATFPIQSGLYQFTIIAYDTTGTLIDAYFLPTILFFRSTQNTNISHGRLHHFLRD